MKAVIKFLSYHFPQLARLVVLHERGTIRFVPMSHREVRANGPHFVWKGWVWGVSPSGHINPLYLVGGKLYSPANHESGEGQTWAEYARDKLGVG